MLQHGVGTITFYEPETKKFAALGHGILDVDTNKLINIGKGELVTSKILSIVKMSCFFDQIMFCLRGKLLRNDEDLPFISCILFCNDFFHAEAGFACTCSADDETQSHLFPFFLMFSMIALYHKCPWERIR